MKAETTSLGAKPCGRSIALLAAFILHPSSFTLADSIFVGSLERQNVIIKELKEGSLVFEMNGITSALAADRITKLVVSGEQHLTTGEDAFATGKWDQAVDAYQRALTTSAKPWVKDWAAKRLIEAAGKSNRFDAAASAYIQLIVRDPAVAKPMKPAMPDAKSSFLETAAAEVNRVLRDPKLSVDQQRALLEFLVELQRTRKDQAAAMAAYERLAQLPGADVNDPMARRVLADGRISAAARALEAKNYQRAIEEIEAGAANMLEAPQQVEALYILAEARYNLAGAEPDALKDAALMYMRVVAMGKNDRGLPHVVESLTKTAGILEKLGETQAAAQLLEQVVSQYPDDPAAAAARSNLQRLKGR